ncbi:pentapeptide repeat-containing protein [Paenibacillus maysiensis]|uniref:pentapeptide repeat-containing protein n=1 Tax=Paenibacillus maysiensis TaxID=1155954 RepID=UPI00046FB29E|nr:pentapeptide repeat-containing protein [Paenibacillus maysiensis]
MEKQTDAIDQQQANLHQAWSLIRKEWALKCKATQVQRLQHMVEHFHTFCQLIRQKQLDGFKDNIGYITYSMLRTTWLEQKPVYLVEATDALWMLDAEPIQFEYDASWIFSYWTHLREQLLTETLKQQVTLSELELEQIMLEAAGHLHTMVVSLIRQAMKQAVGLPEFQALDREEVFEIRVGEYMDHSVSVYREDRRPMDANVIKSWMEEKEELAYSYQALAQVDLSGGDYSSLDFRYTAFRKIGMEHSRLHSCILVGTVWQEAQLDETDFSYSLLHGADFSGCSLREAVLDSVLGNSDYGSDAWLDWEPLGWDGVDFTRASLPGASFQNAQLQGADFQDASLQRASFNGADLTDACFVGADVTGVSFTDACLVRTDFTGAKVNGVSFTDDQLSESIGLVAVEVPPLSQSRLMATQATDAVSKGDWIQ